MQHIENNKVVKLAACREGYREEGAGLLLSLGRGSSPAWSARRRSNTVPPAYTELRGARIKGPVKLANIPMGPVTVELIEPMDGISPWAEHLRDRGEGIFAYRHDRQRF